MKIRVRLSRLHEIQKIRGNLERDGLPRLQMTLLVMITGIAGFIASYVFLRMGLAEMWLRYLAVFGIAYLVFLFLLWLWLRTRADDYVDIPDFPNAMPSGSGSSGASCRGGDFGGGQGGDFGGGGASSSFDAPPDDVSVVGDAGDVVGEAVGAAAQAEEFAIPLIVLIFMVTLLLSTLLMIYSAPTLFAELMLDGMLSASLYHRLRGLETRHWLETAIRRTAWPFLATALVVSAIGWGMALYAPGAHTLGEVLLHARQLD
jgi:hypothetical protein